MISGILFTGIIPGLVIAGIVWAKTGISVLNFFKPHHKAQEFATKVSEWTPAFAGGGIPEKSSIAFIS